MPGPQARNACRVRRLVAGLLLGCALPCLALEPPQTEDEPPRIKAPLEQAWAAESGEGYTQDIRLALMLYCHAGVSGSPEGYYRIGRIYVEGPPGLRDEAKANGYFAIAAQLGHERAAARIDGVQAMAIELDNCAGFERETGGTRFDLARYVGGLARYKQPIAELIRSEARRQNVPIPLVLAIACVESNLDPRAVSPKNAQGIMQLIPDTQRRFGVTLPFDPEQNIRGGIRYIKWLLGRFDGNVAHAAAAYNAGEGAVQRYRGIPPYAETQAYVKRVLFYSGLGDGLARPPK